MKLQNKFHQWALATTVSLASIAAPAVYAQTAIEAPQIARLGVDQGAVNPSKISYVTVHLKLHNEAAFDKAVEDLYTPGSPTFHKWLTKEDFARYAPTSAEVELVKRELQSHGLAITNVDANHYSIRAQGATINLERAFQTQIHEVEYKGTKVSANIAPARLTGAAGDLVSGVTGLTSFSLKPASRRPVNLQTGAPLGVHAAKEVQASGLDSLYSNNCFKPPTTEYLTAYGGAALPAAVYTGNLYYQGLEKFCGWTPDQVQTLYSLKAAYSAGYSGKGQTIAILDEPLSSDYTADLKTFSSLTGLPAITASNFQVIYPDGAPTPLALESWDSTGITQTDIEWAHAIAPQAKIDLFITPTGDWAEFEYAIQYIVDHKLANVISLDYGLPEIIFSPAIVRGFEQTLKVAAAAGVAVNIASGDNGDEGVGSPNAGGDHYPAASAYATSVGGTTIGIPADKGGVKELGWGNNVTLLSNAQDAVMDPPGQLGFFGGAGGGESGFIAKPSWQSQLPGKGRQQPDIAALADPYTGVIVVIGGNTYTTGGTGVATPVFSAIWALADQYNGAALGQAAPLLPHLLSAISDIVPNGSPNNVHGALVDDTGTHTYSAAELVSPLSGTTTFYSALFDNSGNGAGAFSALAFGTDSTLKVTAGWDNVTGYGSPKGFTFIKAAAALK